MITTLLLMALVGAPADGLEKTFVASGATAKVGSYRPIRAEMDGTADSVTKAPDGLTAPKYGTLQLGDKRWAFILDEPEGETAALFVDTNADGDLTNDPETSWKSRKSSGLTMYQGKAKLDLGSGQLGAINLYRFDPQDPRRATLKNTMLFYTDYGYALTLKLDDTSFTTFVAGEITEKTSLWIDRDANKKRSYKRETIKVGQPFNFTGTTYVLKLANDGKASLEKSAEALPVAPLPPNLAIGEQAIEFEMTAMDGTEIQFPKSYEGKLVMLDFWATWCGPCIRELPNVTKAYEDWHDKGFDILGVSFDNQGMDDKLNAFIKKHEMPWRHVYEGKGWDTTLGEKYDVGSIPFVLLVDGDTGEILATARELRGPGLSDFIGKALAKKQSGG